MKKFLPYLVPHIQLPRKKDPFFAPDKSYDFFLSSGKKNIFFQKVDNVRVVSRSNTKKGSLKFGTVKRAVAKGEENEAYRQNGIL